MRILKYFFPILFLTLFSSISVQAQPTPGLAEINELKKAVQFLEAIPRSVMNDNEYTQIRNLADRMKRRQLIISQGHITLAQHKNSLKFWGREANEMLRFLSKLYSKEKWSKGVTWVAQLLS